MAQGGKHRDISIRKIFQTPNRTRATKLKEMSESFATRTDDGSLVVAMQSQSFLCYLGFWRPTLLEAKREEFVDDALTYAKSLCEELEISFEPPRRIRRKHIFGDGSKDVKLLYEDDLRRTMFSSVDRATA
ncbi:uncharacterized protein TNCV_1828901 [Trichonephila clavipes]|nr:uncharacterized protein TNCV_1828901 [Trichonephila clavipes]